MTAPENYLEAISRGYPFPVRYDGGSGHGYAQYASVPSGTFNVWDPHAGTPIRTLRRDSLEFPGIDEYARTVPTRHHQETSL